MGKKRHSQDKMFLSFKELVEEWGGKGNTIINKEIKLPFNYCNLSFCPFENPVCTEEGTIYDILNILPYIKKFKKNLCCHMSS